MKSINKNDYVSAIIGLLCTFSLLLSSCSRDDSNSNTYESVSSDVMSEHHKVNKDVIEESENDNIEENDDSSDEPKEKKQHLTWRGYECTIDCSGHEAGYEWAENNSINDSSDCNGNSNSFNEGCESYVEENE